MAITFENSNDVIVYTLEKIISFARDKQYCFVANCVWWIAGIIGLDEGLSIHIDNLVARREIDLREISSTPRDIARDIIDQSAKDLPDNSENQHSCEPLRQTRQGRINPRPQSK